MKKKFAYLFLLLPALALVACSSAAEPQPAAQATAAPAAAIPTQAPAAGQSSAAAPAENPLTAGYTFRPVSDIIDQELLVQNFAGDGTATLPIETAVPVACSVVYGTTPAFGKLTLDQDMNGGTHSSHNPLLTGLEPDTLYYFRVQGVDDDGVVYLSEVMSFTTPPQQAAPATENLASPAMGAEVMGYSSAFGGAAITANWGAGMAFDDNPATAWSSAGDGNDAWVEVKLAHRARIDRVAFHSRAMSDGTAITYAFTVTTEDGQSYGPFDLPDTEKAYEFDVAIEAQTLRFNLTTTSGGNTGAVDIAVYGQFLDN